MTSVKNLMQASNVGTLSAFMDAVKNMVMLTGVNPDIIGLDTISGTQIQSVTLLELTAEDGSKGYTLMLSDVPEESDLQEVTSGCNPH